MKYTGFYAAALAAAMAIAPAAQATNATVENALKSRPELSDFYNGLMSTGVLSELKEGQPYTVFAPTNEAFSKISADKYPCFYTPACKEQVAIILRKHIVPGEKHLNDMDPKGGVDSLFSIDNQHITASEPNKDNFTVDGTKVLSANQLLGGMLYKIDGVLATDRDLVQFQAPTVAFVVHEKGTDLPPPVAPGKIVTITSTTDATTPIPH